MLDCKPKSTKLRRMLDYSREKARILNMSGHTVNFMESWIYLTLTKFEITYAVGLVSGFMQTPKKPHLNAIKGILYHRLLLYKKMDRCEVTRYCDVNYVGDHDTH